MDLGSTCPAEVIGVTTQLFGLLIQTIYQSYCSLKPNLPDDYAQDFINEGKHLQFPSTLS